MRPRPHHETWHRTPPRASAPPALRPWLTDPGSLTARIRARCGEFRVQVLRQGLGRPCPDEAALLGMRAGELARIREVLLIADGRPVVFARSLLPPGNVRGAWRLLRGIGDRPLGALLFATPAISRAPLACVRVDRRDARYHRASAALRAGGDNAPPPQSLWARRSVFHFRGRALMVSEFFLPAILDLPK